MTPRRNFKIKLVPATLAALLPALLVMIFASVLVAKTYLAVEATTQRLYDTQMEVVFDSMRQVRALERLQRSGRLMLQLENHAARTELRAQLESVATDGVLLGQQETRQIVSEAFALFDRCLRQMARNDTTARANCVAEWQPIEQALVDRMESISALASTSAANDLDTMVDAARSANHWSLLAIGIGLMTLIALSLWLYVLVVRPLLRVTSSLELAREGEPPKATRALITEVQQLNDAALALAHTHRDVHAARTELERLANTDQLTHLANRREFAARGEAELERRRRTGTPLAVVCVDIDHFKQINDRFGHAGGDIALRAIADAFRRAVRTIDIPARLGGEEFAILMPATPPADAVVVAERLRAGLAGTDLTMPCATSIKVTASFGVAMVRESEENLEPALRRADEALYRAKHNGRNRVELATDLLAS